MFRSFLQAGFEGTTGYNRHGEWIDQIVATEHDLHVNEDYARLRELGLLTVREAVRWPLVNPTAGRYDFSSLVPFLEASTKYDLEIIYDLFHFGYPAHIDLFTRDFPSQFADYCYAVGRYLREQVPHARYFTPVNEPSFFSWAAGEVGLFAPHARGRGFELKVQLIRAALAGINALRAALPTARIVNVDPLCRVAASPEHINRQAEIHHFNEQVVFQSWDMLSGRLMPELGGSRQHLDIVGINYYWTNQWEWCGSTLPEDDARRVPLSDLIRAVWQRYRAPMLITETSHLEDARALWWHNLKEEVTTLLHEQVPLHGVCLYPILSMPEWHARNEWARLGLWDLEASNGRLARVPHAPLLEAIRSTRW
ncbi:MAG TPA: glycoside hydrolase [Blastocatellia bacterium]|nr:glycoside hydrolase [Blastocatellia bacterium]